MIRNVQKSRVSPFLIAYSLSRSTVSKRTRTWLASSKSSKIMTMISKRGRVQLITLFIKKKKKQSFMNSCGLLNNLRAQITFLDSHSNVRRNKKTYFMFYLFFYRGFSVKTHFITFTGRDVLLSEHTSVSIRTPWCFSWLFPRTRITVVITQQPCVRVDLEQRVATRLLHEISSNVSRGGKLNVMSAVSPRINMILCNERPYQISH